MVSLLKRLPPLCPLSVCTSQLLRAVLNYTWRRKTACSSGVGERNHIQGYLLVLFLVVVESVPEPPESLPVDQRSKRSGLFLILQGYDWRFDPASGCLQEAWPKMWSLLVLPKQLNT